MNKDRESKLIIENLWDDDDEVKIKKTFSEYSDVATVSLIKDINGALLGSATVVFKDYRSKAIALRNMNALKPYNIIDPDPNSDLKGRRKHVFVKQTITETLSPSRKAVSWSTEQNLLQLSHDTIVPTNNLGDSYDDSHSSNLAIQPQNEQKNHTNDLKPTKRSENSTISNINAHIENLETKIQEQLGTKVTLRYRKGKGGSVNIKFFNDEDLQRILDKLGIKSD